jgi:hypothetical protein
MLALAKAQPTKDEKNYHDHADDVDDVVHASAFLTSLLLKQESPVHRRLGECPAGLRASSNSGGPVQG